MISDHDHDEYARRRHRHDNLEQDSQDMRQELESLRDHSHEYAERRHRHDDLEHHDQELRREIQSLREAFRELRSDLEDAFTRISALEAKGRATSARNRARRFQPRAGRSVKSPQRVGTTARQPKRRPRRTI